MACELAFAFGNDKPRAQHWGLIVFQTPISLCRLPWKDGFQFLGQLPISCVLPVHHRAEGVGVSAAGFAWGWNRVPFFGSSYCPALTGCVLQACGCGASEVELERGGFGAGI